MNLLNKQALKQINVNLTHLYIKNIFTRNKNLLSSQRNIFSSLPYPTTLTKCSQKNFFSSRQEDKSKNKPDEQKKSEDTKKPEEMNKEEDKEKTAGSKTRTENTQDSSGEEEEEIKITHKKYVQLKTLYNEQTNKYEVVRKKFEEVRALYMENVDETERIKTRYTKEISQTKDFAISKFAKDLLDVHDNFERAIKLLEGKDFKGLSEEEKKEMFDGFVEGIRMVQSSLTHTFNKHGVKEYKPLKEKFDPHHHDAVFDYEDEGAPGTVGQVLETGFKIGERVLRPAKVGVIKKK